MAELRWVRILQRYRLWHTTWCRRVKKM